MKLKQVRLFTAVALVNLLACVLAGGADPTANKLVIHADQGKETISRMIYGHFSEHLGRCIYEGYWVGENSPIANTRGIRNDVVAALKKSKIPVLRWPGGCFADEYHWKDGIGPRRTGPTRSARNDPTRNVFATVPGRTSLHSSAGGRSIFS